MKMTDNLAASLSSSENCYSVWTVFSIIIENCSSLQFEFSHAWPKAFVLSPQDYVNLWVVKNLLEIHFNFYKQQPQYLWIPPIQN